MEDENHSKTFFAETAKIAGRIAGVLTVVFCLRIITWLLGTESQETSSWDVPLAQADLGSVVMAFGIVYFIVRLITNPD